MYECKDRVLKKSISMGICEGFVVRAWKQFQTDEEYVRIRWDSGFSSTTKASAVLPYTEENLTKLEEKRAKHEKRWQPSA